MTRGPRRWYTGSEGMRLSIESRTCPRCGRKSALGIQCVDGHFIQVCRWARVNKCFTGPPNTRPKCSGPTDASNEPELGSAS